MQALPKVIPINELKNTAQISKTCQESEVPIIITKNGYSDMVMMSVKLYEQTIAKLQAAVLVNESLDEIDNGGALYDGGEVFDSLRRKYGEKS